MLHLVAFKKRVNKLLMLSTHGLHVVKQKLCVNVNLLMNCELSKLIDSKFDLKIGISEKNYDFKPNEKV